VIVHHVFADSAGATESAGLEMTDRWDKRLYRRRVDRTAHASAWHLTFWFI